MSALDQLSERIRKIVCTVADKTRAMEMIEHELKQAAIAVDVPVVAMDMTYTRHILQMPLDRRIREVKKNGHHVPDEWVAP
ncbi:hypothetical protein [Mesorhizobium sp. IMUNJ 23232]|uniref:hypothetical protein n=1 Tax=Mesorhizobium sp. IMUNJ 23232 TaxID=3376064 RepID=UPI0037B52597